MYSLFLTGFAQKPGAVHLVQLRYPLEWAKDGPMNTLTARHQVDPRAHTHHEGEICTLVKAPQVDTLTR